MSALNMSPFDKFGIKFEQSFETEYLRNNKTNGSKNIRCFPKCSLPHHCSHGFCWQPIKAQLSFELHQVDDFVAPMGADATVDAALEKLIIVGEFQPCDEEFAGIGKYLDSNNLIRNTDGNTNNVRYFIAKKDTVPEPSCCNKRYAIKLRFDAKAWSYSWNGNRYKKMTTHSFVITVLKPMFSPRCDGVVGPISGFEKVAQFLSPPFKISCMRRSANKNILHVFDRDNEMSQIEHIYKFSRLVSSNDQELPSQEQHLRQQVSLGQELEKKRKKRNPEFDSRSQYLEKHQGTTSPLSHGRKYDCTFCNKDNVSTSSSAVHCDSGVCDPNGSVSTSSISKLQTEVINDKKLNFWANWAALYEQGKHRDRSSDGFEANLNPFPSKIPRTLGVPDCLSVLPHSRRESDETKATATDLALCCPVDDNSNRNDEDREL
jgi:hypothetical protein